MTTVQPASVRQLRDWLVMLPRGAKSRRARPEAITATGVAYWCEIPIARFKLMTFGHVDPSEAEQHRLTLAMRGVLDGTLVKGATGIERRDRPPGQPIPKRATIDLTGTAPRINWSEP